MKSCDEHWKKLKAAIEARGLMPKVSTSGEEAAAKLAAGAPDPLMAAYLAIVGNATNILGPGLYAPKEDGSDRCPLCTLIEQCSCGKEGCRDQWEAWIERAADDQVPPAEARS